jgi:aspartyl-tRNA synthetase
MLKPRIKDLTTKVGQEICLVGWVDARRDHGKLIFINLRDATGKIQAVLLPTNEEAYKLGQTIRPEWVIEIKGVLNKRPEKMINPDIIGGDVELEVKELKVLAEAETLPLAIDSDGKEINEEVRLAFRYLDLRRQRLALNIKKRHLVWKFLRDYLADQEFVEVETPILSKSTPEGARDYLVPSRLDKGKFYALPQSPQQYKQLLMVAGIERYFQFARCLRDEDTRGDRQPEFTQLDIEASFVEREDILVLLEEMINQMVITVYPDKEIKFKPWPRLTYDEAMAKYQTDRPDLRTDKQNQNELAFCWIIDFPLFENEMKDGHYAPSHHMFTMPKNEDLSKLKTDPSKVKSYQYDIALNGFEIGGGSIRIHKPDIQSQIFGLIGFDEKDKANFKHMLKAFTYGVPPHGGIALGLDRLIAILQNEPNIREVIAFPKTGEGRDLMMNSPSSVNDHQLNELGLEISDIP